MAAHIPPSSSLIYFLLIYMIMILYIALGIIAVPFILALIALSPIIIGFCLLGFIGLVGLGIAIENIELAIFLGINLGFIYVLPRIPTKTYSLTYIHMSKYKYLIMSSLMIMIMSSVGLELNNHYVASSILMWICFYSIVSCYCLYAFFGYKSVKCIHT